MALASGDDARAKGVHRVGVDVFSFRPNVFTFRANVFSFRRFSPPMCSLSGSMCSPRPTTQAARAATIERGAPQAVVCFTSWRGLRHI